MNLIQELKWRDLLYDVTDSAIEQVLEASFDILGKDADKKINYFEQRIKAINGYW